jgi:hypothetical protein
MKVWRNTFALAGCPSHCCTVCSGATVREYYEDHVSTIVSLDDYRARRGLPMPRQWSPVNRLAAAIEPWCDAQQNLAAELRNFSSAVSLWQRSLGHTVMALRKYGSDLELERVRAERCKADCEEIGRLIESGDIDACVRLRDVIVTRDSTSPS